MSETLGFIGLGNMGEPIAANLIQTGYGLRVYNRTASKTAQLVAKGSVVRAIDPRGCSGARRHRHHHAIRRPGPRRSFCLPAGSFLSNASALAEFIFRSARLPRPPRAVLRNIIKSIRWNMWRRPFLGAPKRPPPSVCGSAHRRRRRGQGTRSTAGSRGDHESGNF